MGVEKLCECVDFLLLHEHRSGIDLLLSYVPIQRENLKSVGSETLSPNCEVRNPSDFGLYSSDLNRYPEPESNRHEIALIGF